MAYLSSGFVVSSVERWYASGCAASRKREREGWKIIPPVLVALRPLCPWAPYWDRKVQCQRTKGQVRSPSMPVAVPPRSEAWRARSGGEACNPLGPFRQKPTGLQRQFYYYASHFRFTVMSPLLTVRRTNGQASPARRVRRSFLVGLPCLLR